MDTRVTFDVVKSHPQILAFIEESDRTLAFAGYTDHGLRHLNLVADRASTLAREIGLSLRDQELCAIAGFCHDMGNFMGRTQHHYWGALLFHQVFCSLMDPGELTRTVQAIANHDKEELKFSHEAAAILVLADKSDVHRSRVRPLALSEIRRDIHNRVNYGTLDSDLKFERESKRIVLTLQIDTEFVPLIEYFEIFTLRMTYCRKAAHYLGFQFGLVMNGVTLV